MTALITLSFRVWCHIVWRIGTNLSDIPAAFISSFPPVCRYLSTKIHGFTSQKQQSPYQSCIYPPTDAPVSCLKKTILKFTLKELRHISVPLHHYHDGATAPKHVRAVNINPFSANAENMVSS